MQRTLQSNAGNADDVFRIHLPISLATLSIVKKEINKRCKLNPHTCKLKYLDEDEEWILMTSDAHIRRCISCRRSVDVATMEMGATDEFLFLQILPFYMCLGRMIV
ncbi:NIN-like protein [Artemisia annua]|uniref:NIN-like protein n=1 Tax=Artemisia annua TaxID=35608 RepID=A0A2U1PKJ1_ARTAN|nr:NIN-like protein [Artemisia annua]